MMLYSKEESRIIHRALQKKEHLCSHTVQHIPPIITSIAILDTTCEGEKVYQIIEVWLRSYHAYYNNNRPLVSDTLRTNES
jgi:hypothetical protein